MPDRFTVVPDGWMAADPYLGPALERTWDALNDPEAVTRVSRYYSVEGDFAGATFLELDPVNPYSVTASDLAALTLLDVKASPGAARRLLSPRSRLASLLGESVLPLDSDLQMADAKAMSAMEDLYRAVKPLMSQPSVKTPNAWVTASKLCARKRPDLFPVRDRVVCKYLGILKANDYQVDWQVFRHLIQDNDVRRRVDEIVDESARQPGVDVGHPNRRLRHLDVLLWMHARR